MARIAAVTLNNLFNHRKTVLATEEGQMFLFMGEEGDGKSGIIRALDLAITGRCELDRIDGDKLTVDGLWDAVTYRKRQTDEPANVILEVVGTENRKATLMRNRKGFSLKLEDGTSITTRDGIAKFLGVRDLGAVEAGLRSQRFMEMKSEERVRLLFATLATPLTIEELQKAKVDDEEVQRSTLDRSVTSGRSVATTKRRDAKRVADELDKPEPAETFVQTKKGNLPVSKIPKERILADIEKLTNEEADLREALGACRHAARADETSAASKEAAKYRDKTQVTWEKADKALKDFLASEETAKAKVTKKAKDGLLKAWKALNADLPTLEANLRAAEEALVAAEERCRWLEEESPGTKDVECSWCHASASRSVVAANLEKARAAAEAKRDALRSQRDQQKSSLDATAAEGTAVTASLDKYEKALAVITEDERTARTEKDAAERAFQRAEEATRVAREAAAAAPKASPEKITEDLGTIAGRLSTNRMILEAIRIRETAIADWKAGLARVKQLREVEARYASMEEALSETGFIAQKVEKPRALLRAKVAEVAKAAFRVPHDIEVRDDMTVWMDGASAEGGSRGENWLVGAILAVAFTSLSRLGIVVLDDLNLVGPIARDKVIGMLLRAAKAGDVQQVFLACTSGRDRWCDSCGGLVISSGKGTCTTKKPDGSVCGAATGPSRPRGQMVGILRTFGVSAGTVTEALAVGTAATA